MSAFTAIVTSTSVILLGSSGTQTTLAFPSGVTATGRRARMAMLGGRLVIVGGTSAPLWLSPDLQLRLLAMPTPAQKPTLAVGAAGGYTGARRAKVSFLLKDFSTGRTLAEGPLSAESDSVTFAGQKIVMSTLAIAAANQPVNARRIYFTTAGGATYFPAFDIDDNTTVGVTTAQSDASLSIVAAPTDLFAAKTDFDMIAVWKNRLWARSKLDEVWGTSSGIITRWPNGFSVEPVGSDSIGITGFLARRDDLGILRRDRLWKLTGDTEADFALVKVVDGKGCVAPDSCLVIRNVGFFMSDDGVYTWDSDGVMSITDEQVRPWFTTDSYFNRAYFAGAFAAYNPVTHRYLLFVPSVGSTVNDRWIEFDIQTRCWFGPHKTVGFASFKSAAIAPNASNILQAVFGANDGFVYSFAPGVFQDGDVDTSVVDFDITGKHHTSDPDATHTFLQPTIFLEPRTGTLSVIPYLGDTVAAAGTTQTASMANDRVRLARIGVGRLCALRFRQNTGVVGCGIYGYRIPLSTLGRR